MPIRTRRGAPLRLPVWFTVLAGIPLAALGWLGWRLLVQEQGLEQQRQRAQLEEAAAAIAHDFDRALARWEERLPALASGEAVSLPPDLVALAFDDHGVQRQVGPPLPYYPRVPASLEAPGASSRRPSRASSREAIARRPRPPIDVWPRLPTSASVPPRRCGWRARCARPDVRKTRIDETERRADRLIDQQGTTRRWAPVVDALEGPTRGVVLVPGKGTHQARTRKRVPPMS